MLTFLCVISLLIVLALGVVISLSFTLGQAALDLYAILSFESLLVDDVLTRVERSDSEHLKRFFSSRLMRAIAFVELKQGDVDPRYVRHQMLLYVLNLMEDTKEVIIEEHQATIEWIDANMDRLHALPSEDLAHWRSVAMSFHDAPPHVEDGPCAHCARELLLEYALFVRKLPKGSRPPRLRMPSMRPAHA